MIRSLRGRLFIGLTAIIILTGMIAGIFASKWAFDEAIEVQDSVLIQLASLAQNGGISGGQPLHRVEEDSDVWLIELGKTPRSSADDRQLFTLQDGLQVARSKNRPIRVLLRTRSDGSRFAVAQPTAVRYETARDIALRTLLPILALIPCVMLATALVIARSLRPMVWLAIRQIEDSGLGIASTHIDRIFEPFFRGSRPTGEGSGLGLSIVKRIVDSLGAAIALENIAGASGSGLRVTVRLPVVGGSDSPSSQRREEVVWNGHAPKPQLSVPGVVI